MSLFSIPTPEKPLKIILKSALWSQTGAAGGKSHQSSRKISLFIPAAFFLWKHFKNCIGSYKKKSKYWNESRLDIWSLLNSAPSWLPARGSCKGARVEEIFIFFKFIFPGISFQPNEKLFLQHWNDLWEFHPPPDIKDELMEIFIFRTEMEDFLFF